jgi:hypothetical protein
MFILSAQVRQVTHIEHISIAQKQIDENENYILRLNVVLDTIFYCSLSLFLSLSLSSKSACK